MEIRVPRVLQGQQWVCSLVWMLSYSAANAVFMSRLWVIALFQGDQGQRGVMGEPGPPGEKVRWCINIIWSHRNKKKPQKTFTGVWVHNFHKLTIHTVGLCQGWSRAKRNHRCSGSKGRACELSVMTNVHSEVAKYHLTPSCGFWIFCTRAYRVWMAVRVFLECLEQR